MKKISKFLCLISPALISLSIIFLTNGFSQDIGTSNADPQPPPVDIIFTAENTPSAGQELTLKLKITPLEDMHADISCLLPEGIEPIRGDRIMVRPYADRHMNTAASQKRYRFTVGLWVGPLTAGITKEFTFRVKIPDNEPYEFIARVDALAKWGAKEKPLVIDIE